MKSLPSYHGKVVVPEPLESFNGDFLYELLARRKPEPLKHQGNSLKVWLQWTSLECLCGLNSQKLSSGIKRRLGQ